MVRLAAYQLTPAATKRQQSCFRNIKLETQQSSASERPRYMPKAAAIHYLNVYYSGKRRSRLANKQRLQWLPHLCHSLEDERSSSSHWRTGTGKTEK